MDWIYDNANDNFTIEIGTFIDLRNIALADITEVRYMIKSTASDTSALVDKTLGDGLTKVAGATEADAVIKVQLDATDFGVGVLEAGGYYRAGLGIKTSAMSKFLEIQLDDPLVHIESDFIHD